MDYVTTTLNARSTYAVAAEPVARTVKENVPAVLGVPDNRPIADKVVPAGTEPENREKDTASVAVS